MSIEFSHLSVGSRFKIADEVFVKMSDRYPHLLYKGIANAICLTNGHEIVFGRKVLVTPFRNNNNV